MTTTVQVRISKKTYDAAKSAAITQTRSANEQIDHWSKIGRFAEAHPFLPYAAIQDILAGIAQEETGELDDFDVEAEL